MVKTKGERQMKLPNGLRVQGDADGHPDVNSLVEAIVRDCAKVCEEIARKDTCVTHTAFNHLLRASRAILAHYGLEEKDK